MFDARLKVALTVVALALGIIVLRLAQLQVVRGDSYRAEIDELLTRQPEYLAFVRGSILDRTGEVLIRDEPSWEVRVDFRVLALEPRHILPAIRRYHIDDEFHELNERELSPILFARVDESWERLAEFARTTNAYAGKPPDSAELKDKAYRIANGVDAILARVQKANSSVSAITEEYISHPILSGLTHAEQIEARELFRAYPWIHVEDAKSRTFVGDQLPMAHVLGRMGQVDSEARGNGPDCSEDPLACYRLDDVIGIAGVERTAEDRLRGRRGMIQRDRYDVVTQSVEPTRGQDVRLTIRADLQRALYEQLAQTVERQPYELRAGAVAVVLHVPTRDVLALVSYPSYDPSRFGDVYDDLRRDIIHSPLRFRAVDSQYAPGSVVKPLIGLAALWSQKIERDTQFECTGYLFPALRDRYRCWATTSGIRKAHGSITIEEALAGSCNVFMYHLGEQLADGGMWDAFERAGFGRSTGTGLFEESRGVNPFKLGARSLHVGDYRNFAIGQGELTVTPIQVANLMAFYASGTLRDVRLLRDDPVAGMNPMVHVDPAEAQAIRNGLYRVVNDPGIGTAFSHIHFRDDGYVLCGKTGSATTHAKALKYRATWISSDGEPMQREFVADSLAMVRSDIRAEDPAVDETTISGEVLARWPSRVVWEQSGMKGDFSHAWFAGFLQEKDPATGEPVWTVEPKIAFVVLVEYGGSGGNVAGVAADDIARTILDELGPQLDPDPS